MQAGLREVSALVREPCANFLEEVTLARASNEASGTMVPTTLVDDAELVWRLRDAGFTQEQVGEALHWNRVQVAQYQALLKIDREAWTFIVTTFECRDKGSNNGSDTEDVPSVTLLFTEYLLRSILDLSPLQQLELCTGLAEGEMKKSAFTTKAKAYKARNAAEVGRLLAIIAEDRQIAIGDETWFLDMAKQSNTPDRTLRNWWAAFCRDTALDLTPKQALQVHQGSSPREHPSCPRARGSGGYW